MPEEKLTDSDTHPPKVHKTHRLRHTFATRSLQAGMSIENLQKLLGHSKTETTLIYAKIDPNDIHSDYKKVYAS